MQNDYHRGKETHARWMRMRGKEVAAETAETIYNLPSKIYAKEWMSNEQLAWAAYAYDISWGDHTFLHLIEAESGWVSLDRKSNTGYWRNGKKYWDFGLAQISEYYHPEIVNDERYFTDYKFQLDKAYELYKGWTVFYWMNNVHKVAKKFTYITL